MLKSVIRTRPRAVVLGSAVALAAIASMSHAEVTGEINAHDPSSIIKQGSTYYYFATGDGLAARTSTDRVNWSAAPAVFNSTPGWIAASVPTYSGASLWAPDVVYRNNQYYLYYSASTFGTKRSGIGLAISPTLDRSAANFGWVDQGAIITSGNSSNFNAIDPAILQDNTTGKLWMTYGSFNAGIFVRELDSTTGKFKAGSAAANVAAPGPTPEIEGASLVQHGSYYYLFANWGGCCNGIDSTYNIRVGRSASPTGPFLDQNGVNMLSGGGTLFLDDDGARTGPGHFALYSEGGQDQFSYHYYDGNRNGAPAFGLSNLYWSADAWPSIAPTNPNWNGASTANWTAAANWSGGVVPNGVGSVANFGNTNGLHVVLLDNGGKTLSRVNFASASAYTVGVIGGNAITLDAMSGDALTTLNVSAGNHSINAPLIALDDLGVNVTPLANTLTLAGGVNGKSLLKYGHGTLALGGTQAYAGSIFVHAGSLVINSGTTSTLAFNSIGQIVGDVGVLTVQGTAAFASAADLNIGDSGDGTTAATGTLNIRDTAAVTIGTTGGLYIGSGFFAGSRALGTLNQSGGTLTANGNFDGAFVIGGRGSALAAGIYNLSGGTATANTNVQIGGRGTGTVNQIGGTFNANNFVSIGRYPGSNGVWNLGGGVGGVGSLNHTNAGTLLIVGESGTGTLNVNAGGTVTTAGGLRLGHANGGSGTVNLNTGGTITTTTVSRLTGSAQFNFDGGTLRASNDQSDFFRLAPAESEIKLGGAILDSNGRSIAINRTLDGVGGLTKSGAGTLNLTVDQAFTGGVNVNAGTLRMTRLTQNGSISVAANATLSLNAPATAFDPARRSVINGTLDLADGSRLDIERNVLVIDYTGDAATPLAALRADLAAGLIRGGAANASQTIGYADASSFTTIPNAFGTVDATSLLVRFTTAGDATLDGTTDFDDLLTLAKNFSTSGDRIWHDGDFDYDADVDFDDLLRLAKAFQSTAAAVEPSASLSPAFAADWSLAQSLVPEPAAFLSFVTMLMPIARRRR